MHGALEPGARRNGAARRLHRGGAEGAVLLERFLEAVEARRRASSSQLDAKRRARYGQFFTARDIASLMAEMVPPRQSSWRVLDPGAGVGSLAAAVVVRWLASTETADLHLTAYEIDDQLIGDLRETLDEARALADGFGRRLTADVRHADFVLEPAAADHDVVIMNPPYRKLAVTSTERRALEMAEPGVRVSNLYAAFLVRGVRALAEGGTLVAITPRSFANGPYFRDLRAELLRNGAFRQFHLFDRRDRLFADAEVLQENLIFSLERGGQPTTVEVRTSPDARGPITSHRHDYGRIVEPDDQHAFIRLPLDGPALAIAASIARQPADLASLGLQVSTGRVVDFRSRDALRATPEPSAVPLLYPQNLRGGLIQWPLNGRKPQALTLTEATRRHVVPIGCYVVVKRFSAKEESRRVTAALCSPSAFPSDTEYLAFENHLNVFHRNGEGLPAPLAIGLVLYLNSSLVDEYVRQFSGHTQINATDLRQLRYPSPATLEKAGAAAIAADPLPANLVEASSLFDFGTLELAV